MIKDIYSDSYYDVITEGWNKISFSAISNEILKDKRLSQSGNLILDVGCGTGLYFSILTKTSNIYYGIDSSVQAVKVALKNQINVIASSAEYIPFSDETFDYIFSTEVIEHVGSPEKMLNEIYRVLKPGACGLITTTTYQFIIFHYLWVLSDLKFRLRDFIKYPLGYLSKSYRDEFVRLMYDFTGGHLWGFLKGDLIKLFSNSSLEVEEVYYLNTQPIIPFRLKGNGLQRIFRKIVDWSNAKFLYKEKASYGPNIVLKFRKLK